MAEDMSTQATEVYLPQDLIDGLTEVASVTNRSHNDIIVTALRAYLTNASDILGSIKHHPISSPSPNTSDTSRAQRKTVVAARGRSDMANVEASFYSDPAVSRVFDAMQTRLGKVTPYGIQIGQTADGEFVHMSVLAPSTVDPSKVLLQYNDNRLEGDWLVLAIRDRNYAWAIPLAVLSVFLRRYPGKPNGKSQMWPITFGSRDGEDRLWLAKEYSKGGFLNLTEYRFDVPLVPAQPASGYNLSH
jgi:hypothetical protein